MLVADRDARADEVVFGIAIESETASNVELHIVGDQISKSAVDEVLCPWPASRTGRIEAKVFRVRAELLRERNSERRRLCDLVVEMSHIIASSIDLSAPANFEVPSEGSPTL